MGGSDFSLCCSFERYPTLRTAQDLSPGTVRRAQNLSPGAVRTGRDLSLESDRSLKSAPSPQMLQKRQNGTGKAGGGE